MTRSSETGAAATKSANPIAGSHATSASSTVPASPAHSDKSTDSRVREKLEETRIDVLPAADRPMTDAPNGDDTAATGDQSTSGSESGRGRIGRKRSHDSLDDDERPNEKKRESHARKKSRDVTSPKHSDGELATKPLKNSVSRIDEHESEHTMTTTKETPQTSASHRDPATPEAEVSDKEGAKIKSPQNKRTLDQAQSGDLVGSSETETTVKNGFTAEKTVDEREPKRQREKSIQDLQGHTEESSTKVCNSETAS